MKINPDLEYSIFTTFLIYLFFIVALVSFVGISMVFLSQFSSISNDSTQVENTRNHNLEYFTPFCQKKNFEDLDVRFDHILLFLYSVLFIIKDLRIIFTI